MSVLIVDDEFLIRSGLAETFRESNFEAYEAAHADEAMGLLEKHADITLVVTDIDMPEGSMNGLLLAQAIRDRWPPVHIFVMSDYRRPAQGEMPEAARYFAKPYSFDNIGADARRLH